MGTAVFWCQAWVWNPSHPQFCRHRGGNMERTLMSYKRYGHFVIMSRWISGRSTNFGSTKVAQGDVSRP